MKLWEICLGPLSNYMMAVLHFSMMLVESDVGMTMRMMNLYWQYPQCRDLWYIRIIVGGLISLMYQWTQCISWGHHQRILEIVIKSSLQYSPSTPNDDINVIYMFVGDDHGHDNILIGNLSNAAPALSVWTDSIRSQKGLRLWLKQLKVKKSNSDWHNRWIKMQTE